MRKNISKNREEAGQRLVLASAQAHHAREAGRPCVRVCVCVCWKKRIRGDGDWVGIGEGMAQWRWLQRW